jgi:hypothetical protein
MNGWSYVENNPVRYVDPSGLCGRDWGFGAKERTRMCKDLVQNQLEAAFGLVVYWPNRNDLPAGIPDDIECFCIKGWDCDSYADEEVKYNTQYKKWRLDEIMSVALAALLYDAELGRNPTRAFLQGVIFVRADKAFSGASFGTVVAGHHFPSGLPGFGSHGDMK